MLMTIMIATTKAKTKYPLKKKNTKNNISIFKDKQTAESSHKGNTLILLSQAIDKREHNKSFINEKHVTPSEEL